MSSYFIMNLQQCLESEKFKHGDASSNDDHLDPSSCEQCVQFIGFIKINSLLCNSLDLIHQPNGVVGDGKTVVLVLLLLK